MRVDNFLQELRSYIQRNPRPTNRDRRERALDVFTHIISGYDDARDQEAAIRENYARENPGFYSFLEVKPNKQHIVDLPDLEAFGKRIGLTKDQLLRLGEGEVQEIRGWRRGNHTYAKGKAFKPARPTYVDEKVKRMKKEGEEAQKRYNASVYTLPPDLVTTKFNPNESENR